VDPMDPEHWIEYCLITITKILEINPMNCLRRSPFMNGLRAFRSDSKQRFLMFRLELPATSFASRFSLNKSVKLKVQIVPLFWIGNVPR
jgi:hypothetical protein